MHVMMMWFFFIFFFNDTATTEIYTLSLHDALPIYSGYLASRSRPWCRYRSNGRPLVRQHKQYGKCTGCSTRGDRKSTRLNSSHLVISYAVFCLKKKKKILWINLTRIHYDINDHDSI